MKVKIECSNDQVLFLNSVLKPILDMDLADFMATYDKVQKMNFTIMKDVANIVNKKHATVIQSNSLFDQKKRHKLNFKYHEAYKLHAFLLADMIYTNDDHKAMLRSKLINQLDKKIQ